MKELITVTRRFEFDAAHRVLGHTGKCRHLHGHRYMADLTVVGSKLNALGMVVDFSVLKTKIGTWIERFLDHNILLHKDDPLLKLRWRIPGIEEPVPCADDVFNGKLPLVLQTNPTAEELAKIILGEANCLLHSYPLTCFHVRLYETPNCWADYTLITESENNVDGKENAGEARPGS